MGTQYHRNRNGTERRIYTIVETALQANVRARNTEYANNSVSLIHVLSIKTRLSTSNSCE